jgi:threonine/homoserine/homoserine lactone efflux protein
MRSLSEVREDALFVYGLVAAAVVVVALDAVGVVDVSLDLPLVALFVAVVGALYLKGKFGVEKR